MFRGVGLRSLILCGLILGLGAKLEAADVVELSLAECVRLAVVSNTDVAKGRLDRLLSRLDRKIGQEYFWPDLYVRPSTDYETDEEGRLRLMTEAEVIQQLPTGGYLRVSWDNHLNRYTELGDEDWTSEVGLRLSQPLLRGAGIEVGTSPVVLSGLDDDIDRLDFEWLLIRRITSVQKHYWDLMLAYENLDVAHDSLARNLKQLEERRGKADEEETLELESEVAEAEQEVEARRLSVAQANLTLIDLIDAPGLRNVKPKGPFQFNPVAVGLETSLAKALKSRPDLLKAKVAVDAADLRRAVAESNAKTDLDLVLAATTRSTEPRFGEAIEEAYNLADEWIVGLGAELRFGVPNRERDAVAARYRLRKTELDFKEREQAVSNDVTTAVYSIRGSLKTVEAAQRAKGLAERKLAAALVAHDRGEVDSLKVIIYQRDLTRAQLSVYRAIVGYLYDLADLDQATGATLSTWKIEVGP